ncbi:MAG: hypothetical protein ACREBR_05755 [bacterium]
MAYLQEVELDWNTFKVVHTTLSSATVYYLKNDLQYVPFIVEEGTSPIQAQSIYYCGVNRDPKAASGPYAPLTSGVKASAHIQNIVYTATSYGASSVTIAYVSDAPAVGEESVTVVGNAITVHIVSGSSTAQQVYTAALAWQAYNGNAQFNSQAAAYLVSAVIDAGKEGIPQVTQAPTALTGGTPAVTNLSDWETNFKSSATLVASFSIGVGLEL